MPRSARRWSEAPRAIRQGWLDRITALPYSFAQALPAAGLWLAGGFETAALDIELPAVKRTAQAIVFITTERKVGVAMRTVAVQQPKAARSVAKQDQVLTEQAHRLHGSKRHRRVERRIEFIQQGHRLPVTPQEVSAGRAGTDARDEFVFYQLSWAAMLGPRQWQSTRSPCRRDVSLKPLSNRTRVSLRRPVPVYPLHP